MLIKRVCKICGAEYTCCVRENYHGDRWQDVGCCIEHAMEYFQKVNAARESEQNTEQKEVERVPETTQEPIQQHSAPKARTKRAKKKK